MTGIRNLNLIDFSLSITKRVSPSPDLNPFKITNDTLSKKDRHLAEPGSFLVASGLFNEKINGKKHTARQGSNQSQNTN
jgi:hypothetical protein